MKANTGKGFDARNASMEDLKIHWVKPEISDAALLNIPLAKVLVCPKAFQMRHVSAATRSGVSDPNHVSTLADRLEKEGALDPILVLPISYKRYVVIDGFHRRAAYQRRQRDTIPVIIFTGTPSEAKLVAIRENAKAKLQMTPQEKSNYLWTLIKERPLDDHGKRWTLKMCSTASDRSIRLAEHMNGYLARCKDRGLDIPEHWHGGNWEPDAFGDDNKVSKRVQDMAYKLRAVMGDMKTSGSVHLAAKAFAHAYGQAGKLAAAIAREAEDYEAVSAEWQEHLAGCLADARQDWEDENEEAVEDLRDRLEKAEQHTRDLKMHGSITNLLFGAAREAGSLGEFRKALALS